jgi:ABC-type microcin C transport system duplicated ATPase subunit YejF
MRSLSPLHRLGNQVAEVLHLHQSISAAQAKARVMAQFERVGFVEPERAWNSYPFEMSGGMRQRAMIAMAMVSKPDLLIADEPTTALDVTTQAQVLGLIKELQDWYSGRHACLAQQGHPPDGGLRLCPIGGIRPRLQPAARHPARCKR